MKRLVYFCVFLFSVSPLIAVMPGPGFKKELCTIDEGIEQLTNLEEMELARADTYETNAKKLKKSNPTLSERFWTMHYNARDIASRYRKQIYILRERRTRLITYHGLDPEKFEKSRNFCR